MGGHLRENPRTTLAILLALVAFAAVAARSLGFFQRVFADDTVVLQSTDPWIHTGT